MEKKSFVSFLIPAPNSQLAYGIEQGSIQG
jgi:hypothetical protein